VCLLYVVAEWEGTEVGVYYVQCVYYMWSQSGKVRRWEVMTMFSVFIICDRRVGRYGGGRCLLCSVCLYMWSQSGKVRRWEVMRCKWIPSRQGSVRLKEGFVGQEEFEVSPGPTNRNTQRKHLRGTLTLNVDQMGDKF
jgi:hypothetical protein